MDRQFPPGRFGYLAPYRWQSKKIAWMYLQHYAAPLLEIGGKKNESDLIITMPHNGATIELYGADNADAIRGGYFDGLACDEAQSISRQTLSQIILPCLADYQGWLDCSGTPRGWQNLLGELVKMALADPANWYLQILRASETGIIPAEELARQKALMSENEYAQEFECSFDAAITGAVYGKQIADADAQGRLIPDLEPIHGVAVNTSWDVGYNDMTTIWWWQVIANEIRILDYYENSLQDIPHYCDVIKNRAKEGGYTYGKHYVPHDAAHKLLAAGGRSIVEQADALGVRMWVQPATTQQNAIEALRVTLPRCFFNAVKCEFGIQALRQYQFEWDADRKVFRDKPRHDWASHAADAAELMAQVWRKPPEKVEALKPKFLKDATFNDLVNSTPRASDRRI